MTLPTSAPITLSQIQSEFSAANLSAASTAAGLDPLPTSMLDFLGLPLPTAYLDPSGYYYSSTRNAINDPAGAQAFVEIHFRTDGRLEIDQGTNEYVSTPFINGGQWLSTSPGTVSTTVAQGWDIELTKISGPPDGFDDTLLPNGGYRAINSDGTAWGTRYQLGSSIHGRLLIVTVNSSLGPVYWDETLIFTASIYLHGTNTLVASSTFELYVQVSTGAEA
jgi:hypothetical protein